MNVEVVLDSSLGSIVAPAGCGKTHLITEALSYKSNKPTLVLTHTTAGVTALKKRLRRLTVPSSNYVITTIDGWALRLSASFPSSCPVRSSPNDARAFYPEFRRSVLTALNLGGLNDIIAASYSRLLVDEYQDCGVHQHKIISELSKILPTVVFGDPMQCIFDFAGPVPSWNQEVETVFTPLGALNTPWRWNNVGAPELGEWILSARDLLERGEKLDLNSCPRHVFWYQKTGNDRNDLVNQNNAQYRITNQHKGDSLLVIGSSINAESRHRYAQSSRMTEVVEPVQLAQVVGAAEALDRLNGIELVQSILVTVSTMATNIEMAKTRARVESILQGRNRKPPTVFEASLCNVAREGKAHGCSTFSARSGHKRRNADIPKKRI